MVQIQLRRDTAANWTSVNPTLAAGEFGVETDTLKVKVGNGSTAWNSLAYLGLGTDLTFTASTRLLASSTGADVTLPLFTSTEAGLTPFSGGGTTNFLRADGTWAAPPTQTGTTNLSYTASTRVLASDTGTDATLPLVSSTDAGLAPASGGGTTNFLRADGTWAAAGGGSALTVQDEGSTLSSAVTSINFTGAGVTATGTTSVTVNVPNVAASGGVGDEYWNNVTLLTHFTGANAGTTFTEATGVVLTGSGNAQTSTAQYKFGPSSGLFDGTGDYVSVPYSAAIVFGTSDFTLECWIYQTTLQTYNFLANRNNGGTNALSDFEWMIDSAGRNSFTWYTGSTSVLAHSNAVSISLNTWTHVAVTRKAGLTTVWINGVAGSVTATNTGSMNDNSSVMYIGNQVGSTSRGFIGYIDEFRVTKGVARYNANFTPPAYAFAEFLAPPDVAMSNNFLLMGA